MATLQTSKSLPLGAPLFDRAAKAADAFMVKFEAWKKISKAKAELSLLSDRELKDIGIARGDIGNLT